MLAEIIIDNIEEFLSELGIGYSFIKKEYPIKKEHIGQIETYMNFIDKNLKTINQNQTIGIIVCKKKNGYLFKYVTNKNIYEREYELI